MFIVKTLGVSCVPFLERIVPTFLRVLGGCEAGLREFLFQQIAIVVAIVKTHARAFLGPIFKLVRRFWSVNMEQVLVLVEEISLGLQDDFKLHMAGLTPLLMRSLHPQEPPERTVKVGGQRMLSPSST